MSNVMWGLCSILHIKALWTTIYHPQTDGLVERFNRTLKGMIRDAIQGDPRNWDQVLAPLLFAMREAP